jgi:CheY-like chemotaxis protein
MGNFLAFFLLLRLEPNVMGCHLNSLLVPKLTNATLLIVEDNQAQQFVYKQLCHEFDCSVVFCSSGEDALEALKLAQYAAVLLDLKLPGIDGIEVAVKLRLMEVGSGKRTPIIVLTGSALQSDEKACIAAGVDEFISKPFAIEDFRRMLLRRIYQSDNPNLKLLNKPNAQLFRRIL